MQDKQINVPENSRIVKNDASGMPPDFLERLAASDVVILVGSSESQEKELTMHMILPSGLFAPERIASHAYAQALNHGHSDLVRTVHGLPTDAARYQALRDFACLAGQDPERFEAINAGLQAFEETEGLADEATTRTPDDFDRIADFVLQSLIETEPAEKAPDQEGLEAPAPSIILSN